MSPIKKHSVIPDSETCNKINSFFDKHSPQQLNRHLRFIMFEYIGSHVHTGLPVDFNEWLWEFNELLDLLDDLSNNETKGYLN